MAWAAKHKTQDSRHFPDTERQALKSDPLLERGSKRAIYCCMKEVLEEPGCPKWKVVVCDPDELGFQRRSCRTLGGCAILSLTQVPLHRDVCVPTTHIGPQTWLWLKLFLFGNRGCLLAPKRLTCWQKVPIMFTKTCVKAVALHTWVINHTRRSKPYSASELRGRGRHTGKGQRPSQEDGAQYRPQFLILCIPWHCPM